MRDAPFSDSLLRDFERCERRPRRHIFIAENIVCIRIEVAADVDYYETAFTPPADVAEPHRGEVPWGADIGFFWLDIFVFQWLRQLSAVDRDGLPAAGVALDFKVGAVDICPYKYCERPGEILLDFIDIEVPAAAETVGKVRRLDGSFLPFGGEGLPDDAFPVQGVRDYSEQSVDDCARCYADVVGEIPVCFFLGFVIVAYLPEIARARAKVHFIENVGLE